MRIPRWLVTLTAVGSACIALFALYSFLSYKPLARSDFTAVNGVVERTAEPIGPSAHAKPHLDISLQNNPLRFRVPIDAYEQLFKKAAFWQHVRPGSSITFFVEGSELHNPFEPPDGIATVFVAGVQDTETIYLDLEERLRWFDSNHWTALYVGLGFLVSVAVTVYIRQTHYPEDR